MKYIFLWNHRQLLAKTDWKIPLTGAKIFLAPLKSICFCFKLTTILFVFAFINISKEL